MQPREKLGEVARDEENTLAAKEKGAGTSTTVIHGDDAMEPRKRQKTTDSASRDESASPDPFVINATNVPTSRPDELVCVLGKQGYAMASDEIKKKATLISPPSSPGH